jgi:hypothetical protein
MMRIYPNDPTCYLLELADLDERQDQRLLAQLGRLAGQTGTTALGAYLQPARAIEQWTRDFICNPHPDLGRAGAVCPYVRYSMDRDLFWITVHRDTGTARNVVCRRIMTYRDWFLELEPRTGREAVYKTLLVLFPDVAPEDAPDAIDALQADLKPEFVEKGLMIGQFHAHSSEPGTWNSAFCPLRSPLPLLVIRNMVQTDFVFLRARREYLAAYLRWFGDQIPPRMREAVREQAAKFGLALPAS